MGRNSTRKPFEEHHNRPILQPMPSNGAYLNPKASESLESVSLVDSISSSISGEREYLPLREMLRLDPRPDDRNQNAKRDVELRCEIMHLIAFIMPDIKIPHPSSIGELGSGAFNRVLGVTIERGDTALGSFHPVQKWIPALFGSKLDPVRYALRISLHGDGDKSDLARDAANLQVVSSRLPDLVPKTIKYDLSRANPLGKAYLLQERVRGGDLYDLWDELNAHQKMSAMHEVTKAMEKIARVTAPAAGLTSVDNLAHPYDHHIDLVQFSVPKWNAAMQDSAANPTQEVPAAPQTPMEFILDRCNQWYHHELRHDITANRSRWLQIIAVGRSLDRRGYMGDRFHLVHNDLFPRNIMAAIKTAKVVDLTGIIDWDMCCFAPKFVAFRPPFWAWMNDKSERNEDQATTEPDDEEGQLMKKVFLQSASREFIRFAFSAECIIARNLWLVLLAGLVDESHCRFADEMLFRWDALHPEDDMSSVVKPGGRGNT